MPKNPNPLVRPFVKWAGGKRQLLPEIRKRLPERYGTYYEPFVGGGAVFLTIRPKRAVVNDANAELINCYQVVRDQVEDLIQELAEHQLHNSMHASGDYYYTIRDWDRDESYARRSGVERAARIIYLNKTCYNGLFRVNAQGQFNVPYGKHRKPNILDEGVLRAVSDYLNQREVEFRAADFEVALAGAKRADLVYFDPPYDPVSDTASFTGYDVNGFDQAEQERLKSCVDHLTSKGCYVMLSNADTPLIRRLYQTYKCITLQASRAINSDPLGRGKVDEILVMNYEPPHDEKRRGVGKAVPGTRDTRQREALWVLPD